jgi:hypothetical protein
LASPGGRTSTPIYRAIEGNDEYHSCCSESGEGWISFHWAVVNQEEDFFGLFKTLSQAFNPLICNYHMKRNLISFGFNSPQLAAVKSVPSTFRYLVVCREVVHFCVVGIFFIFQQESAIFFRHI